MDNIAFCSVAVTSNTYGVAYLQQQDRCRKSILKIYPDAKLFFWRDYYPPGSRDFLTSLYGFKPHAIKNALDKGYTKVIWTDAAIILQHQFNYPDVVAIHDPCKLPVSDKCLEYFGIGRSLISDIPFVGGSWYYFNFENPIARYVLDEWIKAEQAGIFGSQREESEGKLQGHRHDETVMGIILYKAGIRPLTADEARYNQDENSVVIKKHFK